MEPVQDWLLLESKLLHISSTHIDFGRVPLLSVNRNVIFVQNLHTGVLRYRWVSAAPVQSATNVGLDTDSCLSMFYDAFALLAECSH